MWHVAHAAHVVIVFVCTLNTAHRHSETFTGDWRIINSNCRSQGDKLCPLFHYSIDIILFCIFFFIILWRCMCAYTMYSDLIHAKNAYEKEEMPRVRCKTFTAFFFLHILTVITSCCSSENSLPFAKICCRKTTEQTKKKNFAALFS